MRDVTDLSMPFIPHSEDDLQSMLSALGVSRIEDLFDEIPAALQQSKIDGVPEGMNEMQVARLLKARAYEDRIALNFAGAGAYEHHIPAAVWEIVGRGEFYTAYTPYQAEASQGTLQLIYEFQTMLTRLTGMDVSNASLYDGATALTEAILMAERCMRRGPRRVLVPDSVHPTYRKTLKTLLNLQQIEVVELAVIEHGGRLDPQQLPSHEQQPFTALVVPQPNYLGILEDVDALTDWAHDQGGMVIAVINPLASAVLQPPGQWGRQGVDIVCGEGQPLGVPLSSGGPYLGLLACKQNYIRQMPGRVVGRTTDLDGQEGYVLTLQAREQHIRRAKATSNICTNQGLLVTAATIHMALLGPQGLCRVAQQSMHKARILRERLLAIPGVSAVSEQPFFHEFALRLPKPVDEVIERLAIEDRILAGVALGEDYPGLDDALLLCATETKTVEDLSWFADRLARVLA